MKYQQLLPLALEYYDREHDKIKNILKKIDATYIYYNNNKTEHKYIVDILNSKKEVIFSSTYELISVFHPEKLIWFWSWNIPTILDSTIINKSRKMLLYGLDLYDPEEIDLKINLINPRYIITNPIQIDIQLSIVSYLVKNPFMLFINTLPDVTENNNRYYSVFPKNSNTLQSIILIHDFQKLIDKFS